MLSNIWVYKKTSKVMISLLLAAVLVLATQNWLLGLLTSEEPLRPPLP